MLVRTLFRLYELVSVFFFRYCVSKKVDDLLFVLSQQRMSIICFSQMSADIYILKKCSRFHLISKQTVENR